MFESARTPRYCRLAARKSLANLRRLNPGLRLSNVDATFCYRRAEDTARQIEGLRLAGLAE